MHHNYRTYGLWKGACTITKIPPPPAAMTQHRPPLPQKQRDDKQRQGCYIIHSTNIN